MKLTEEEFLGIVAREERALLGDMSVLEVLVHLDVPRLLAYIRDLQDGQAAHET